mmetsp:Transcript_47457/g.75019  ORF Transcript_47457/g.75019 Transcript_47457/m.75019 type:complete len:180 (-) Transcript_47457:103-642(-)
MASSKFKVAETKEEKLKRCADLYAAKLAKRKRQLIEKQQRRDEEREHRKQAKVREGELRRKDFENLSLEEKRDIRKAKKDAESDCTQSSEGLKLVNDAKVKRREQWEQMVAEGREAHKARKYEWRQVKWRSWLQRKHGVVGVEAKHGAKANDGTALLEQNQALRETCFAWFVKALQSVC